MTGRAKRLTLILGVAVLVAVLAGTVMAPEPAAAAKKPKDPDGGSFTIKTSETYECAWSSGDFVATGAIESSGSASGSTCWFEPDLVLSDGSGYMSIGLTLGKHGTFEILYAEGDYAPLIGATGSYRYKLTTEFDAFGDPYGTISRTLQGSVPE